jgi:thiamine-monophosphate kinase
VTALGLVPRGQALTRRVRGGPDRIAAQRVFVTGTIGDAALGLALVQGALMPADLTPEAVATLVARLRRPEPRLALGLALRPLATAATDISDGLVADLGHIAEVTGCAAVIEGARLPLSEPVRTLLSRRPELLAAVASGGDDYELVFTAPVGERGTLAALAARLGVAITEIGWLDAAPAGRVEVLDRDGQPLALARRGWNHFADEPQPEGGISQHPEPGASR